MSYYKIAGGRALSGVCEAQGSKNSSLPILAAAYLMRGECVVHRCPPLSDVDATCRILSHLGAKVRREGETVIVDAGAASGSEIPDLLMREMRSSVIFLGAVLAKTGGVRLSTPGGCEIGLRPIDIHLDGMRRLGAEIEDDAGFLRCTAPEGLRGADITLSFPSVGATENLMIAAATAKGRTRIFNAAREPEISDLADFLNRAGARICGAGDGTVTIEGVPALTGAEHTVIPDRIAAATMLAAGAITGGDIEARGVIPAHLGTMLDVFERMGCRVSAAGDAVRLTAPARLDAVKTVRTMPYPGFPTDFQAQATALMSVAEGTGVMIETIFESRYKYIGELIRFGARIRVDGRMAVVEGVKSLYGARVQTPDLRGGAALTLAALAARGESEIRDISHIERGYAHFEDTLRGLSAEIRRVEQPEEVRKGGHTDEKKEGSADPRGTDE